MIDLATQAAQINWWHGGMDLAGVVTKGPSQPATDLLPRIGLPSDLSGLSVLDVGTWDGFMAWECERRGAKRVVAVDSFVWHDKRYGREGFDLAHRALHSRVEAVECEVLDLSPATFGTFDIVLFLGVLYHMRHPLLALERVAAMTADLLIVESHVTDDGPMPSLRFYPGSELNNDATNWWGPNVACVEAMLHDVGFAGVQKVSRVGTRAAWQARRHA